MLDSSSNKLVVLQQVLICMGSLQKLGFQLVRAMRELKASWVVLMFFGLGPFELLKLSCFVAQAGCVVGGLRN